MDAEWALLHLQRALYDPVDPRLVGSLADSLHFRVNGEVYRFATRRTLRVFARAPVLWCGELRDPVSGRRFLPSARSPEMTWSGGPYYFESDSTLRAFQREPRKFQVVRRM